MGEEEENEGESSQSYDCDENCLEYDHDGKANDSSHGYHEEKKELKENLFNHKTSPSEEEEKCNVGNRSEMSCNDFSFISDNPTWVENFEDVIDSMSNISLVVDNNNTSSYQDHTNVDDGVVVDNVTTTMSQNWDVVSDIQSVKSVDTFSTMVYKDALLKDPKPIIDNKDKEKKKVIIIHSPTEKMKISVRDNNNRNKMVTIKEQDNDDDSVVYYDADWGRCGVYKAGRGGKVQRMFKGNVRTQKQYSRWREDHSKVKERRNVKMLCRNATK